MTEKTQQFDYSPVILDAATPDQDEITLCSKIKKLNSKKKAIG